MKEIYYEANSNFMEEMCAYVAELHGALIFQIHPPKGFTLNYLGLYLREFKEGACIFLDGDMVRGSLLFPLMENERGTLGQWFPLSAKIEDLKNNYSITKRSTSPVSKTDMEVSYRPKSAKK